MFQVLFDEFVSSLCDIFRHLAKQINFCPLTKELTLLDNDFDISLKCLDTNKF